MPIASIAMSDHQQHSTLSEKAGDETRKERETTKGSGEEESAVQSGSEDRSVEEPAPAPAAADAIPDGGTKAWMAVAGAYVEQLVLCKAKPATND